MEERESEKNTGREQEKEGIKGGEGDKEESMKQAEMD